MRTAAMLPRRALQLGRFCSGSRRLSLLTAVIDMAHPEKKRGEDAHLVRSDMVAVADGVGGWSELGVDPGEYSRLLMRKLGEAHDAQPAAPVRQLLNTAFASVQERQLQGSTTACVLKLEGQELHALNLGDSGYMVVRPNWSVDTDGLDEDSGELEQHLRSSLVKRSKEQIQGFNCPFQLGSGDQTPDDADLSIVPIQVGDLLLTASDGIFDNIFDIELLDLVLARSRLARAMNKEDWTAEQWQRGLDDLATSVHLQAVVRARSTSGPSPFGQAARKHGYMWLGGGKMDDMTLLISRVMA